MRVCRVSTYLVVGLFKQAHRSLPWAQARQATNELFRICWGQFPASGGNCADANAWAHPRSWVNLTAGSTSQPIVITLIASEWLQSDDDVAFILAHEMGHAVDREQNTAVNTEQNEERADGIGIGFLMLAGYDARASARALQLIAGERGQGLGGNLGGMLNQGLNKLLNPSEPHPLPSARIQLMKQVFARLCAAYGNHPIGCKEGWR
jgi:predicted Zn-dependent protease